MNIVSDNYFPKNICIVVITSIPNNPHSAIMSTEFHSRCYANIIANSNQPRFTSEADSLIYFAMLSNFYPPACISQFYIYQAEYAAIVSLLFFLT